MGLSEPGREVKPFQHTQQKICSTSGGQADIGRTCYSTTSTKMPVTAQQHSRTSLGQKCKSWSMRLFSVLLVLLTLAAVVLFVGLLVGVILIAAWNPAFDPRIQTSNTSLLLDIPKDDYYKYSCLHHDDWSECIELKHHGNIAFNITAERTTSEFLRSKFEIAQLLVLLCTFGVLCCCLCCIPCWAIYESCSCGYVSSNTTIEYFRQNDDLFMMEDPPIHSEMTSSSPVIAPDESSGVNQEQSVSEDVCSNRVGHSFGVNIITQVDVHVPSPGDKLQDNRTIWNVEMDKKIDSHNGTPRFIQAMSDKMEDIKDQVKAITAAFDESIISKGYDFFIIYCGKNSTVVNGIIMRHLADLKITYCEHQQHFIPGHTVFSNIQDCISQSRKVLAVFSADFFASEWCRKDLDMALVHATEKQIENFIVPIKIDDCVIPSQYGDLKNITYSDLTISPNDWSVWEQIRCSLASICVASMEIEIRMCPEHLQKPSNSSTANTWL